MRPLSLALLEARELTRLLVARTEYNEWLGNFLHSVELPIVFYCAPPFAAYVKNLRGNKVRSPLSLSVPVRASRS